MSNREMRIAVIGGGVSGLATAHHLRAVAAERGQVLRATVLEASDRPGGVVRTDREGDYVFEGGPDTLLVNKPGGIALCEQLGLGDELATLSTPGTSLEILHRGRLVPVPDGFMMMAPTRMWPVLTSPLFSLTGKLRMAVERFVPSAADPDADESLSAFVSRRFGREVLERVAEPIIAGLFTADADRVSLKAVMPRFVEMERVHGSITRALTRARRRAGGSAPGGFAYLRGGLERLVHRLAESLADEDLRTGLAVEGLHRDPLDGRWTVRTNGAPPGEFDSVVLACPAHAARHVVNELDPRLAERLGELTYASCATVTLVYRDADVARSLDSFGFFVPRTENRSLLACSFMSEKFRGRAPAGEVMVRAFVGGENRPETLLHDDEALAALVHDELRDVLALRTGPKLARIYRFPQAMPQYEVGWTDRLAAIRDRLTDHPGLFVAGSAAGAIGIPDCAASALEAARGVAEQLSVAAPARRVAVR